MSTIAEQLALLAQIKANIKAAIEQKGVTVGDAAFTDYDDLISQISGGGYSDEEIAAVFDKSITSFTLHEGVTALGASILQSCLNMTYLDLPSTLTSIGTNSLSGNRKLETFICRATTPPTVSANTFGVSPNSYTGYIAASTKILYVPHGCSSAYTSATNEWKTVLLEPTKCNFTIAELNADGSKPNS